MGAQGTPIQQGEIQNSRIASLLRIRNDSLKGKEIKINLRDGLTR
jgi:hypothetical protein